MHQLASSIVSAIHQTAQRAQPAVAAILDRIRASPVVHGYVCQHPHRALLPAAGSGQSGGGRSAGQSFSSGQYAAYHHYDGPKQRCWAHLLRDIHDQRTRYPKDAALARWAAAVHQLYVGATITSPRRVAHWPGSGSCWPSAALSCLTRRRSRASCAGAFTLRLRGTRSLRHLVISRKVSGGTRSEQGTESKMTLASLFGTWRAPKALNPLAACRQLLVSPL